jgi:hypothetical protein
MTRKIDALAYGELRFIHSVTLLDAQSCLTSLFETKENNQPQKREHARVFLSFESSRETERENP